MPHHVFIAVLLLLLLPFESTAQSQADDQAAQQAIDQVRSGDLAGAEHSLCGAAFASPAVNDVKLQLVLALVQRHEYSRAAVCIRDVPPSTTPEARVRFFRLAASIHSGSGDARAAAADMEQAVRTAPGDVNLQLAAALAESNAGRHAEAATNLVKAFALAPARLDLLYNLALEQLHAHQLDSALASITKLRRRQDSAEAADLCGDIQEQRHNYLDAVHSYQAAAALAPTEEKYRVSLGLDLIRHQSFDPALAVFQQGANLFPSSARIQIGLGLAQFFLNQFGQSAASFLEAEKLDGNSGVGIRYLGMTQVRMPQGPLPNAITAVCARADGNGGDAAANLWCGSMLYRQAYHAGEKRSASRSLAYLRTANKLQPGDGVANCELGRALVWVEDWSAARAPLETCVRLLPDSGEDHFRLGRVYQHLGLDQAAHRESELNRRARAQRDQREMEATKFVYQILDRPAADH